MAKDGAAGCAVPREAVEVISVEGTTAEAQSVSDDGPIDNPLERVDGTWLITGPPL